MSALEVKAGDPGAGKISVRVEENKDGSISLSVRDNGCGIPEDIQPQVFDPFFTQNDVGEGMGLGLSICHSIIKQHDADVDLESIEGEYALFTVVFPASEAGDELMAGNTLQRG